MRLRPKKPEQLPAPPTDAGMSARVLSQILEVSSRVQAPAVAAYVDKLRRSNPNATPADIVTKLEKQLHRNCIALLGSAAAFPASAPWSPYRRSPERHWCSSRPRHCSSWR